VSWLGLAAVAIVAQAEEPVDAETAALLQKADALNAQAKELYGEGRYAEAEEVAGACLAIREKVLGQDHADVASSLGNLAGLLKSQGDYAAARPLYERSLAIRESAFGPDHADVATSLNNLASLLDSQGDYAGARPLYERSLAIREKTLGPDHTDVATSLNNLASLLDSQGDYAGARPLYERSLAIREKVLGPDHTDVATSLSNLAALLWSQGEHPGARRLLERSLAIREKALGPDHPAVAHSLGNLATLLATQGDYARARQLSERALAIREKTLGPDHREVASSLGDLAELLKLQGDYAAARPLYERSLAIREKTFGPDHPDVANSLNNLATLLATQGEYAAARLLCERSLAIWENALGPDHPTVAHSLGNLAAVLKAQGDFAAARPLYERSLAIREKALGPDHASAASSLAKLAGLLNLQGDYAAARPLYERSLAIREKALGPDHPAVAHGLGNLAGLLNSQGDYAAARPLYERSLAIREKAFGIDHPDVATSLNDLAMLLATQGDYTGARPLYERSLAIREKALGPDHPAVASSHNNLAGLLVNSEGDYAGARPLLERSLAIREKALGPNHMDVVTSLNNLATLLLSQGEHAGARPLLERSLAIRETRLNLLDSLSEREALAYVVASRPTLDGWLRAFSDPADSERAWGTVLRWKGVATRRIREQHVLAEPGAQAIHQNLRETRADLARLTFVEYDADKAAESREKQVALTSDKEDLERQLAKLSAKWRGEREVEQGGATEICAALRDGTGLLDFLRYGKKYLAFAIVAPECEVRRIELGDADSLDHELREWRGALAANDPPLTTSRIDRRGEIVRARVWDPLESALAGADGLIVVPDGALSTLPFGALPMADGGYLLEKYPISYLENDQDLLRAPAERVVAGALLVGDVDFGGAPEQVDALVMADEREATRSAPCVSGDYRPLTGTGAELRSLEGTWGKGRYRREVAEVLTRRAASEGSVYDQMSGKRLVHLATHGFFADEKCRSALADGAKEGQSVVGFNPMLLSGIVLAGANAEHGPLDHYDGILTAEELSSIDVRGTELVVLSACETGLGVVRAGEGVLGLRRAFAAAGVGHLVMSLWSVPDTATSELMEGFYKRVLRRRKPMAPGDAMREAQLEMLQRNREAHSGDGRPGSWAAFVVAGP